MNNIQNSLCGVLRRLPVVIGVLLPRICAAAPAAVDLFTSTADAGLTDGTDGVISETSIKENDTPYKSNRTFGAAGFNARRAGLALAAITAAALAAACVYMMFNCYKRLSSGGAKFRGRSWVGKDRGDYPSDACGVGAPGGTARGSVVDQGSPSTSDRNAGIGRGGAAHSYDTDVQRSDGPGEPNGLKDAKGKKGNMGSSYETAQQKKEISGFVPKDIEGDEEEDPDLDGSVGELEVVIGNPGVQPIPDEALRALGLVGRDMSNMLEWILEQGGIPLHPDQAKALTVGAVDALANLNKIAGQSLAPSDPDVAWPGVAVVQSWPGMLIQQEVPISEDSDSDSS